MILNNNELKVSTKNVKSKAPATLIFMWSKFLFCIWPK